MKAKPKIISIDANFNDCKELKSIFDKILEKVKRANEIESNKEYSFKIDYVIEPRIELVNGIECAIYPSKMNF